MIVITWRTKGGESNIIVYYFVDVKLKSDGDLIFTLSVVGHSKITVIVFAQTSFVAEELFSLGPQELGCLEDKEKPGAKVSP